MSSSSVLSALHALSHPDYAATAAPASRHLLQSSSVSNVTEDAESIYLSAFDRTLFYEVMIVYAAPCAVALIVSTNRQTHREGEGNAKDEQRPFRSVGSRCSARFRFSSLCIATGRHPRSLSQSIPSLAAA